jgi:Ca-activated chloride channel family protein
MRFVAILLLPLSLTNLWQSATRPTNSHAANVRGVKAYSARQYENSANAFSVANAADPTPANAFNLGTAQIAAGQREQGSASLGDAMRDRGLRAAALYNRGNSALGANAFDNAVRDYTEALRLQPADLEAKRNLEIALAKRQQAKQSQSGQQKNPGGSQQNQQRQQQSQSGIQKRQPKGSDQNAEALLRAVQQQEQEELNRMKRAKADRQRVGW